MKQLHAILLMITLSSVAFAQETTYTDQRAGKTYRVVDLGNLQWFASNLTFITPTSWCAEHPEDPDCDTNNWYFNTALDSLCPDGWRVPSWSDWDSSVPHIAAIQGIPQDSILYDTSNIGSIYVKVNLIEDSLTLNVKPVGWVEGNERESNKVLSDQQPANYWILDESDKDNTTHIHLRSKGFLKHEHRQNVNDTPENTRRFTVRCVRNK